MRDVVYTSDDHGAEPLAVSLRSLLSEYHGGEPLRINILVGYGGFSTAHQELLARIVGGFPGTVLRYVDIEGFLRPHQELLSSHEDKRWNIFCWASVFGPQAVGDARGNLLYMDVDTLVCADVSPLFEMDLKDGLLAAVYENHPQPGTAHNLEWDTGILPPEAEGYFNHGVTVFNAEPFRREGMAEKLVGWYSLHRNVAQRIDQDALNALCWNRMVRLHPKWNYSDGWLARQAKCRLTDPLWRGNPPREILEAVVDPAICHFFGAVKPWRMNHRPEGRRYEKAMRETGVLHGALPGDGAVSRTVRRLYDLYHRVLRDQARRRLAEIGHAD